MKLTPNQQKIVDTQGNLIVSASAGTGKTHTMVAKISKELTDNKDHRVIAAITFTIKAAKEIKDRLSINIKESFIGTNNSFAIEEIIKPFMKDAYGPNYERDMTTDYGSEFDNFDEGLELISKKSILGSYADKNKNFIFELALEILEKSKVARLYLQAKYFKIFIDEYQDCDVKMNDFFMYLTDELKIDLFIVGDDKQSLYIWRGAKPEAFKKIITKASFKHIVMSENFRSNKQIQDYSNLLFKETSTLYDHRTSELQTNLNNIIMLNCNENDWVLKVKEYWNENQSSALLRSKNEDAKIGAKVLSDNNMNYKFIPRIPIANISNENVWLYYSIAQFIFIERYSEYDFIYDIPMGTEDDIKLRKKLGGLLSKICINKSDKQKFQKAVSNLAQLFGINVQLSDLESLYKTVTDERNADFFMQNEFKHKSMTIHSSKGLQFEQVIIFAEDFSLKSNDELSKHYVAVTRAKNKLIIVNTNNYRAEQFVEDISRIFDNYSLKIDNLLQIQ